MCLVTVACRVNARYPLAVAANRDERHARPAAAAAWWNDAPDVVGGRDLTAGGSWLAMHRSGRIAAVANRAPPHAGRADRSRGMLVADYVTDDVAAADFAARASASGPRHGPFNLVLVDAAGVRAVSNDGAGLGFEAGVASVGNAPLDAEWPKLGAATAGVERALEADDAVEALLDLLALRRAAPPARGPDRENLFVVGPEFGTRCSTVIVVDATGHATFVERRFDAAARVTGETRFEFALERGARVSAAP